MFLFRLCSKLELEEVVAESSKSFSYFFVPLQYLFADLYNATVTDFQLLLFGNLNILLRVWSFFLFYPAFW